ncbi:XdhC family protein [Arthrobacter sp. B3I4]|uniref:XdhC family protein n=1 Tax=Arthrobacter sp. B3I4 TaxID=3042267 RepID=UPI00278767BC|nr:XdhC family protein [Arthrobacter sp. B3I4]MDQ0756560.1 xanthine dehydrogenase accessory factor [Arthrobacter sp. B3I4]
MHTGPGLGRHAGPADAADLMTTAAASLAARAVDLAARREPFVHATVVRAQHPTSATAGDTALVLPGGEIQGFVGGQCVESSVREYGLQVLASGEPLLLRVLPGEPSRRAEEGAVDVSNPCLSGGAIEIFLQPRLPAPRVVVVGTAPVAQALAALGPGVGFDVELADGDAAQPRPDDAALIVASHGKAEEAALEAALRAGVPYVALVASEARGGAVLDSLDVDAALRSRVYTPAGLQLGARTPGEIALSILAQLVQERAAARAAARTAAKDGAREGDQAAGVSAPSAPQPGTAVDPVCGMSVPAVESSLHAEYNGTTVYFCSSGCRTAFRKDPERYALSV